MLSSVSRHRAGVMATIPAEQVRGKRLHGTCGSSSQARLGPQGEKREFKPLNLEEEEDGLDGQKEEETQERNGRRKVYSKLTNKEEKEEEKKEERFN